MVVGAALVVSSQAAKAPGDNGIYVGNPKVYDEASLENLQRATLAKVAQLSGFDQLSLTKNLGTLQGASADQTQVAAQVSGLPKPGATAQAVSPNSPTQPTLPSFTLPSSFSPSAADLLNEQTQLNFQLTNLQLLLQGAVSDQFVDGTAVGRPRVTLGFPITVTVPPGFQYREAVAEVEISVCSQPAFYDESLGKSSNAPSVVNLIPQEKTYNVASIVSKTTSIGGGAVAGVVNFGGGLLRGHQTFYIVQDVDTLAIPRPPRALQCAAQVVTMKSDLTMEVTSDPTLKYNAATFAWQFRPVLGQKVVRDGTRQTFAQIAMPQPSFYPVPCSTTVYVRSRWRRYDLKTGRVGNVIPGTERELDPLQVASYDQAPSPSGVTAEDNGDGTLTVEAHGTFKAGTKVRIGSQILDSSNPLFDQNSTDIRFTASGSALALVGAQLVYGDGREYPVHPGPQDLRAGVSCPAPPQATDEKASKKRADKKAAADKAAPSRVDEKAAADKAKAAAKKAAADGEAAYKAAAERAASEKPVAVEALTDSTSTLTIPLTGDDQPAYGEIPVVVIGNQVFGLLNNPFAERTVQQVKLVVTNDLLRANRMLKWVRLFHAGLPRQIPIPNVSGFVSFASPAITLLSSGLLSTGLPPKDSPDKSIVAPPTFSRYAIAGQHMDGLEIVSPNTDWDTPNTDTLKTFLLPDTVAAKLKGVIVQKDDEAPIALPLPAPPAAAAASGTTPAKPPIDPQKPPLIPASSKTLDLTGTNTNQVVAVFYNFTPLSFTAPDDKKLTLTFLGPQGAALVPPLSSPGITVIFVYADKSLFPYFISVAAPPPAH
jgi:hypothetical protein